MIASVAHGTLHGPEQRGEEPGIATKAHRPAATGIQPLPALREHLHRLESLMEACLASPGEREVHKLRTETRRVGALLQLAELLPELPAHHSEAKKLLRALTRLRRAAGAVRDLDVHRGMLEALAEGEQHPLGEAQEDAAEDFQRDTPGHPVASFGAPVATLLEQLAAERTRAVEKLQAVLRKRHASTREAAHALLHALSSAEALTLTEARLLTLSETVQHPGKPLRAARLKKLGEADLHDLRKAAKAARYVAEIASESPLLREAAGRFEALQEAGGAWHDALELESVARDRFGARHRLAAYYRRSRKQHLNQYRVALLAEAKRREPATKPALASKPALKPQAAAKRIGAKQPAPPRRKTARKRSSATGKHKN